MISIPTGMRVLLATQPVDFRRGAHGLAALAAEVLGEDPNLFRNPEQAGRLAMAEGAPRR